MRDAASELELDANTTYELMLATTEAFANAVEHWTPCETGGVFVCVRSHGRGVGIEVCDCGGCFPNLPGSRKPREEGGRGIAIIAAIMDSLEVLPDGDVTRVCFEKWLAPA